ncbi:MAG: winged helix-turn-helix domain-containing protein, partial [Alphaproteobacteria bacterium]
HDQLEALSTAIEQMGGLCETQLTDAIEAMARRDLGLAEKIVGLDARIRAVLRRIRPALAEDIVSFGDISIDRSSHRVRRAGRDIHLGPTEYKLLDHFLSYPGRVFSREQLLDAVWGSGVYVDARTVDVHIGRLRKALTEPGEADPIRTVRSAGYALDTAASS